MKHFSSFVSFVVLFYLFNESDILEAPKNIKVFNIYDDLDEYTVWARKRLELLFYECASNEWSQSRKIKKIDEKLLTIFPFLKRIVDRSYVIEKFLTYVELAEAKESAAAADVVISGSFNEVAEVAGKEEEESVKSIEVYPVSTEEKEETQLAAEEIQSIGGVETRSTGEIGVEEETYSTSSSSDLDEHDETTSVATSPEKDEFLARPKSPIKLNQTVGQLRKIASKLGFPRAYIMSKKDIISKLVLYNNGNLPKSELKK